VTFRTDSTLQEKAESLIRLPESSAVIRSVLEFCYSGAYVVDETEVSGEKAFHNIKLFVAADKYDVRNMIYRVQLRLAHNINACVAELQAHKKALSKSKSGGMDTAAKVPEQVRRNWDGLLLAIDFLLQNSCKNPFSIIRIDWASIIVDAFRGDWLEFVASHPAYAAEVILVQCAEEWQLRKVMKIGDDEIHACRPEDDLDDELQNEWTGARKWFQGRLRRSSQA